MLRSFTLLEGGKVKWLRLAALFAFYEGLAYRFDLKTALLLAADQVADRLAVVGVAAGGNLFCDPGPVTCECGMTQNP
jgi:hypothetical protein